MILKQRTEKTTSNKGNSLKTPIVAEGGINYPEELKKVFECGVFTAVVGGAITRPQNITKRFVNSIKD